jgi:hypothetical protein
MTSERELERWTRQAASAQALALRVRVRARMILRSAHKTSHALKTDIRSRPKTGNQSPEPFIWTKTRRRDPRSPRPSLPADLRHRTLEMRRSCRLLPAPSTGGGDAAHGRNQAGGGSCGRLPGNGDTCDRSGGSRRLQASIGMRLLPFRLWTAMVGVKPWWSRRVAEL